MTVYNKDYFESREEGILLEGVKDYYNKRLIIENMDGELSSLFDYINALEKENYVEKIIIKASQDYLFPLLNKGYILEAYVPKFYRGEDRFFICRYKTQDRYHSPNFIKEDEIVNIVQNKEKVTVTSELKGFKLEKATVHDVEALAILYKQVFTVYPVPIFDPKYIEKQMKNNTVFYYVKDETEKIIAAASAEINIVGKSAEITDCATLPSSRKGGYMKHIITSLENELKQQNITCIYSIARAQSFGMNAVLHQLDYTYTGRLKNNCYIFDKIEDMNMWVKI
ncbi:MULTISPECIES: putative beta-lysine N-acetyltransferase [Sutcliffiella]|uniref:Putative beta-lysine N-acetyltransferase n=1 Tax=Sutcliffiella cohnii TaxID=33932 RepID=A0A223KR15_9BACI|nr:MULTISPECIES: putative beta-lysine N-acetyltransferase [Sutcliffiella]AST91763.1 putative beta-lysine N-acetyltransferase [Sutcliffiella cohnii]MED4014682.1 putative beta-lysine N-acetyltransferase [Sutcliffiella cohnii]WBL12980.1 putative beta-lysine N-acetyltransferase [Sutcliffiella sp. NC1]